MKKITFRVNDLEIKGIIISTLESYLDGLSMSSIYLVYAQNRLVTVKHQEFADGNEDIHLHEELVDYCVIPEYDEIFLVSSSKETESLKQNG